MQVLSEITDIILQSMKIIGIAHQVTYDIMVETFDTDCRERINDICKNNGLEWNVIPYPYVSTSNKYDDVNKQFIKYEKIGARIIIKDPEQTEMIEPSIKDYDLNMENVQWST